MRALAALAVSLATFSCSMPGQDTAARQAKVSTLVGGTARLYGVGGVTTEATVSVGGTSASDDIDAHGAGMAIGLWQGTEVAKQVEVFVSAGLATYDETDASELMAGARAYAGSEVVNPFFEGSLVATFLDDDVGNQLAGRIGIGAQVSDGSAYLDVGIGYQAALISAKREAGVFDVESQLEGLVLFAGVGADF